MYLCIEKNIITVTILGIISRIWVFYRDLFLGFEYFNAIYFSDLSIFAIFAPVIQIVTIMTEYIHRNIDSEEKSFIIMITHHKEINARSQLALQ